MKTEDKFGLTVEQVAGKDYVKFARSWSSAGYIILIVSVLINLV